MKGFFNLQRFAIPNGALKYNGHSYYVYSGVASTWDAAQAYCTVRGGHLAVINNKAENTKLYNYIKSKGYNSAYFGLTDKNHEGAWTWVNGESASYRNWAGGEPNGSTYENYAEFYWKFSDGTWNDGDFAAGFTESDSKVFICEWDTTSDDSINYIYNYSNYTVVGGTGGRDYVYNSGRAVTINSGAGNDTVYGSSSTDYSSINSGSGNDSIYGYSNNVVTVVSGTGNDTIMESYSYSSQLYGGEGNDMVSLYGGHSNTVDSGAGDDIISNYSDYSSIKAGDGNDSIRSGYGYYGSSYGNSYYVTVHAGAGKDTITGTYYSSKIYGGDGNDRIHIGGVYSTYNTIDGGAGDDTITVYDGSISGGAGNDSISVTYYTNSTLLGGFGNDTLSGGYGNDILTGGKDKDIFVYSSGGGNDTITDYTSGADKIKITSGSISKTSYSGKDVIFTIGSGTLTVKNGKGKKITINGKTKKYSQTSKSAALLTEDNFETSDNLSSIVKNDLSASVDKIETQNFDTLTPKDTTITFTTK